MGLCSGYRDVCVGGRAAHHSEVSKQARLVERQVCFTSGAGSWGGEGGGHLCKGRLLPPPKKQRRKAFIDRVVRGVARRNSTVLSNSHLQLVISGLSSIILVFLGTLNLQFWVSVQLLSCVRLFATPWTAARQASLSITNSWSPPKPHVH